MGRSPTARHGVTVQLSRFCAVVVLAQLVLACSPDPFSTVDAGSDDGAVLADARKDGADGDGMAPDFCSTIPNAAFCDEFERTSVRGTWTTLNVTGSATAAIVPGWSGSALHASADGAGARAFLARPVANVTDWQLWLDMAVAAAPGPTPIARVETPNESVTLEVDGSLVRIAWGASPTERAELGTFKGVQRVQLAREQGAGVLRVRIGGQAVANLPLGTKPGGAAVVAIGVLDVAMGGSVATDVRIDRVAFALGN
jgi:hypothetical protein